jgi:hypothetical protein
MTRDPCRDALDHTITGRIEADAVRTALTGALVFSVYAPEVRGGRTLDFDGERFEHAQARRGLYSSPACFPEPLVAGVPDGRHHSRYS